MSLCRDWPLALRCSPASQLEDDRFPGEGGFLAVLILLSHPSEGEKIVLATSALPLRLYHIKHIPSILKYEVILISIIT